MDNWENIKEALKLTGGKYILAEKGEPSYVVVELDDYVDLLKRNGNKGSDLSGELKPTFKNPPDPLLQRGKYQRGNFQERNSSAGLENLSERGLIEKINGSINVWKDLQDKRMLRKMEVENATMNNTMERGEENSIESDDSDEEKIVIEEI